MKLDEVKRLRSALGMASGADVRVDAYDLRVVVKRLAELEARDAAMRQLIEQASQDNAKWVYVSHIHKALGGGA